jgi:hypothetical protein
MTTYDVLRAARAYLLEHGWQRGGWGTGTTSCAGGAIVNVENWRTDAGFLWDRDLEGHPAARALCDAVGVEGDYRPLAQWNDANGRTFDEVIAAFDAAIEATAPPREDTPIFTALEDLSPEQYIDCVSTLALLPAEAISA